MKSVAGGRRALPYGSLGWCHVLDIWRGASRAGRPAGGRRCRSGRHLRSAEPAGLAQQGRRPGGHARVQARPRSPCAGRKVVSNVINGNYLPPTLRVRRGDTIRVKVDNEIGPAQVNITGPQPTNVHYHGMDVAPKLPNGDNVFIRIKPDKELRYDVFVPEGPPAGPALVPRPRPHLRRRPDRLRDLRHADRRRLHREAVPGARRPAAAGHGVQGLHLPRLQGWRCAGQVAQRLRRPADPRPARRVPDLGAGQSRRRRVLRHEARGSRGLGDRARRQPAAEARADGPRVPAAGRAQHRGRAGRGRRHLFLPAPQRRHRTRGRPQPVGQARHVHRLRHAGRRRQRHPAAPAPGTGLPEPDPAQLRVGGQAARSTGRATSTSPRAPTATRSSSTTRPTTRTASTPRPASARSSVGSCATSPRRCTSFTCIRPSS